MTTDEEEPEAEDTKDQDLDLEKLFDSLPSEEVETGDDLQVSPPDEISTDSIPVEADSEAEGGSGEGSDDARKSGRFDGFLERMGSSQDDRAGGGSSDNRQQIEELLSRMDAGKSAPAREGTADDESLMDIDASDIPGGARSESGPSDSDAGASEPDSDQSADLDTETLEGLTNLSDVLFNANRSGGTNADICTPFFSITSPSDQNVLLISLRQSSEDRLDAYYAGAQGTPANLAVITSSDAVRSTTTATGEGSEDAGSNITVKVINDPGDLTRLGITISNVLDSWQGNGKQTLVCFDSLSSLLQYADLQRVFRFIHVLQGRLGNVDATTHYHLDPQAHDSQTKATMRSLFDGVITVSESGELSLD